MKLLNLKSNKITPNKTILFGALAIMLAAFFWSLDGVFIRPKFYELPAGLVVFLEHALGFLFLSPFIVLNWKKIKSLSKKSWGAILWISIFGGMLGTLMITKAFFAAMAGETTFATVILLQKLQPVFALLLARLVLRERLSRQFYFWSGLAIISAYFLAFGKTGLSLSGIDWLHHAAFFAFLAAFSFGSSTVFGKRIVNHLDFRSAAALRFGITSALVFILVLITGDLSKVSLVSNLQWWLLLLIVFTSGAAAMFIYYFGLKRVTASTAAICELFWPFSAVILDYVINKNVLNTTQIIFALILLFAFYKVITKGRAKNISFKAKVIKGAGRGRQLGFLTANLDKPDLDMAHGVYVVEVEVRDVKHKGIMHFGFRETFGEQVSLEILIKDFLEDIYYGQEIRVEVINKIREVKKFKNIEELKTQVKGDLEKIK
ncbi:MAG: EamA family transporter [Candidatus Kuenenbacteria bacterium]